MFGRQSGLSGGSGGNSLVEFRAGKMNMVGKMVHPDTRKGLVYLSQADDGLIHFCWKDRNTGKIEDDLIVFPDDFEFKRVEQCKTGRVYVLKFKTSTRRLFFWMQEPKTDKDDEFCRRVNETMNNPPSANRSNSNDSGDLQYMLNNMSQQQLMQLFGGVGQMGGLSSLLGSMNRSSDSSRSTTTPTSNRSSSNTNSATGGNSNSTATPTVTQTPENASSGVRTPSAPTKKFGTARVTLPDLQNYLSALSPESGSSTSRAPTVDLSSAVSANAEEVNKVLSDPDCVKTLVEHLPDIGTDEPMSQQLKDTLLSPQFQQAMSMFSSALQSGQLGPVCSQFKLSPEAVAAANTGDLEQFVKALEKSAKEKAKEEEEQKKEEEK
ncbi:proteasomal ubiquitin receptor ADRM1 homolog [Condylostylus longicornis]|uniref:proteasomal ubiquitin receptor ADRM1 homolog n=1 Tax=Condylostylus longicornis TaxID=2530218 RepID=UPI00244E5909|nr:proteasomal ubiquitin receptor ADRM1 homolog [Condylostylus longicornis]